jgi:hypothetical protein
MTTTTTKIDEISDEKLEKCKQTSSSSIFVLSILL